jgi:hypothetical protein
LLSFSGAGSGYSQVCAVFVTLERISRQDKEDKIHYERSKLKIVESISLFLSYGSLVSWLPTKKTQFVIKKSITKSYRLIKRRLNLAGYTEKDVARTKSVDFNRK